jgi:hypothetical protein
MGGRVGETKMQKMNLDEALDYVKPVAEATPLEGYGLALNTLIDAVERATNLHDLQAVIKKRRLEWNGDRSLPLDVVIAEAVIEYLGGGK